MTITAVQSKIGAQDINWRNGQTDDTFTRLTSSGGSVTLTQVGTTIDVCAAFGSGTTRTGTILQSAISTVGSADAQFDLSPGNWTLDLTAALSIPANIRINPLPGALIDPGDYNLTINNLADGINYQIISLGGTGKVYMPGAVLRPEMWGSAGDGATDDTTAMQNCLDASKGQKIEFSPDKNYLTDQVTIGQDFSGSVIEGNHATWSSTDTASVHWLIVHSTDEFIDLTYETMTGDLVVGETQITVGGTYSEGDWVYVRSNDTFPDPLIRSQNWCKCNPIQAAF